MPGEEARVLVRYLRHRPWTLGDNVNLAVGQGDLQATPLQMAVAYSAIVNGGRVVRPHLGLEIEDDAGRVLQKIEPPAARRVKIDPGYRAGDHGRPAPGDLRRRRHLGAGLSGLAAGPVPGVRQDRHRGAPALDDQSWYVAYVPNQARPIVVAVTIEQGGLRRRAAAPAARLMLSQWFGVKKKLVQGNSHTR